jgi:hypothetical protein
LQTEKRHCLPVRKPPHPQQNVGWQFQNIIELCNPYSHTTCFANAALKSTGFAKQVVWEYGLQSSYVCSEKVISSKVRYKMHTALKEAVIETGDVRNVHANRREPQMKHISTCENLQKHPYVPGSFTDVAVKGKLEKYWKYFDIFLIRSWFVVFCDRNKRSLFSGSKEILSAHG